MSCQVSDNLQNRQTYLSWEKIRFQQALNSKKNVKKNRKLKKNRNKKINHDGIKTTKPFNNYKVFFTFMSFAA